MDSAEHQPLEPLSDEARRTELALQQLRPRPLSLDRERLMFLAGVEAGGERREARETQKYWIWPAATAAMTAVAASLLIALSLQLARPPVERVVVREVPVTAPSPMTPAVAQPVSTKPTQPQYASAPIVAFPSNSALQMRNLALRLGVEALPAASNPPPPSSSNYEALNPWQQLRKGLELPDSSL